MAREPHKKVHPDCPNGATTWAACDRAALEARGRCVALTEKATECSNWATDEYDGRGYCGVHYGSRVNAALEEARVARRREEMSIRIDAALAWHEEHPSVHDPMPREWWSRGESNPVAADAPGATQPSHGRANRPRVLWSASSGEPLRRRRERARIGG